MDRRTRKGIFDDNKKKFGNVPPPPSYLVRSERLNGSKPQPFKGAVRVLDMTTSDAVRFVAQRGYRNIVVHNFASSKRIGGGYETGAKAQEEDCCRCFPLLFESLSRSKLYPFKKKNVIVTPSVPMARYGDGSEVKASEDPIKATFVSASAPNARIGEGITNETKAAMRGVFLGPTVTREWSARDQSAPSCIIVGAWGCGVYRQDPEEVAKLTKEAVSLFGYPYDLVVVAVPVFRDPSTFNTFRDICAPARSH